MHALQWIARVGSGSRVYAVDHVCRQWIVCVYAVDHVYLRWIVCICGRSPVYAVDRVCRQWIVSTKWCCEMNGANYGEIGGGFSEEVALL